MKIYCTIFVLLNVFCNAFSQTLYVPGGTSAIGNNTTNTNIGVGTSTPSSLLNLKEGDLRISATTTNRYLIFDALSTQNIANMISMRRDDSPRWLFGANGNNGVDDFMFSRYSNTGTYLNTPLLIQRTSGNVIVNDGKVGIGTPTPLAREHVHEPVILGTATGNYVGLNCVSGVTGTIPGGNTLYNNNWIVRTGTTSADWYTTKLHNGISIDMSFWTPGTNTKTWWERDPSKDIQSWGTDANTYLTIKAGSVGIGTTTPGTYKLAVAGKIAADGEVRVFTSGTTAFPDYVFDPSYKLPSLEETELYVKENRHLPEVPSAKEIENEGMSLNEMNVILLKKVEELTLHLIELKKDNDSLRARIEKLEK